MQGKRDNFKKSWKNPKKVLDICLQIVYTKLVSWEIHKKNNTKKRV